MKQSKTFSSGFSVEETIETLRQLLAASQAREAQLREALEWEREFQKDQGRDVSVVGGSALALPQDTAALSAIVTKAGEAMRERCAAEVDWLLAEGGKTQGDKLRTLPGVTLEDLRK